MVGAVQRLLIVSPIGMHLVLTLGKLGEIAPLEWERVPAGLEWEGTRDPTTSASCVLKNPHGPLLRPSPPRFHDSIIKDSPDRTPTFQQHMNSLPVSLGDNYRSSCETVAVYINMSSDYYSTILNNYSTCHPNLGYYCLPLHCPALLTAIWSDLYLSSPVCFATTIHLPNQKHSSQPSCPLVLLSQIGCFNNGSKGSPT